jgi:OOP family OmpA-OmpF porin
LKIIEKGGSMRKDVRFITAVLIVFSLVVFSGGAIAENKGDIFTLSPHAGGFVFDTEKDLSNGAVVGLGFGYNYTATFGIEATLDYINTDSERSNGGDAEGYMYRLGGLYYFMPEKRFVPYISAGLGGLKIDNNGNDDDTDAVFDVGAGFKYFLADDLAFRADVRNFHTFEDSVNNYAYTFGLTFHFGAKSKMREYTSQDSDGDGVLNEIDKCPRTLRGLKVDEYGCPLPVKDKVSIALDVEFDFDSAEIRPKYHKHLKEVANFLKKYPDTTAVIEGHTDNSGPEEYNIMLSRKRANSVRKYLIDRFNIPHYRLDAKGFGESRPIADNSNRKGRQRNRRVTAVISTTAK